VIVLKIARTAAWGGSAILVAVLIAGYYMAPSGREHPTQSTHDRGIPSIGGPFELVSHKGKRFTHADVAGKAYLVFFGFTHCPDVCPTTLSELTILMDDLGADADRVTPIMITVDPERDTQKILSEYMSSFDSRIVALTGTPQQTEAAVKAFKAYYKKVPLDGGEYTMDHTAGIYMMSAAGAFVGTLDMHEPQDIRLRKLRRLVDRER
jgi:protein SCO1/2